MFAFEGGNKQEGQPQGLQTIVSGGNPHEEVNPNHCVVQCLIKCSAKCHKERLVFVCVVADFWNPHMPKSSVSRSTLFD